MIRWITNRGRSFCYGAKPPKIRFSLNARPAHLEEIPLIFLAFVVPLAIYSLILTYLNRQAHPAMVPGPWDFAGVLLAGSGLLLFIGPAILTALYEHWRLAWLLGRVHFLHNLGENWYFWMAVWAAYFLAIVALAGWMLWRQRMRTSIYNVQPDAFMEVFLQVCDRLDLETRCSGQNIVLRARLEGEKAGELVRAPSQESGAMAVGEPDAAWRAETDAGGWAAVQVDAFPVMRHVTLHWQAGSDLIRQQAETELATALTHVWTRDNPVGGWFLTLTVCFLAVMFLVLLALAVLQVMRLRL